MKKKTLLFWHICDQQRRISVAHPRRLISAIVNPAFSRYTAIYLVYMLMVGNSEDRFCSKIVKHFFTQKSYRPLQHHYECTKLTYMCMILYLSVQANEICI